MSTASVTTNWAHSWSRMASSGAGSMGTTACCAGLPGGLGHLDLDGGRQGGGAGAIDQFPEVDLEVGAGAGWDEGALHLGGGHLEVVGDEDQAHLDRVGPGVGGGNGQPSLVPQVARVVANSSSARLSAVTGAVVLGAAGAGSSVPVRLARSRHRRRRRRGRAPWRTGPTGPPGGVPAPWSRRRGSGVATQPVEPTTGPRGPGRSLHSQPKSHEHRGYAVRRRPGRCRGWGSPIAPR